MQADAVELNLKKNESVLKSQKYKLNHQQLNYMELIFKTSVTKF